MNTPSHHPRPPDPPRVSARPIHLHPETQLAFSASHCPLYANALALARWAGPTVPVTPRGFPEPPLIGEAVRALSLRPAGLPPEPSGHAGPTRAEDLSSIDPLFALPWWEAIRLGMVELTAGQARPAPDLEERARDPRQILRWWNDMFETTVESARGDLAGTGPGTTGPDLLPRVLRSLYEAPDRSRVPLADLVTELSTGPEALSGPSDRVRRRLSDLLLPMLWQLTEIGAVHLDHRHARPSSGPCLVRLTPLGRFGVREILLSVGVPAPLIEDFGRVGAAEFLDSLHSFSLDGRLIAIDSWLAARTPARALREIGGAVDRPGSALRRWDGAKVLNLTSSHLGPHLRALLGSERPALASLAAIVLLGSRMLDQGEIDRIMEDHGPWVVVDMVAAAMSTGEVGLVDFLTSPDTAGLESLLLDDVDRLRRVDHPDTVRVLEALCRVHPDPDRAARFRAAAVRVRRDRD
ncbi:hypothetical protein PWG71_18200 [Nocardiopsis sp. N85]|uniref:hypothetical protein n=1 Tax=Nocardiopsis sp. N85 TaxID=3029400 RepID=UPI00237F468B|nr:hypothetical protein [Nocardiopsis sp. N85]MDE3723329.1 hypothetical protein [Nocardiopsis sp. N85]